MKLKADTMLNTFEGQAHTVLVCVYQFKDPNDFKNMSQDKPGVLKLLQCNKFSEAVTSAQKVVVQPGELRNVLIDRAEGAKYVGLVAGYYEFDPKQVAKLYKIPIDVVKKGVLVKKTYQFPAPLNISLILGPNGLREGDSQ